MATSHSQRSEFMRCRRKWFYGYILGIEPDTESDSLRMGKAFAIATEKGIAEADAAFDISIGQAKTQAEYDDLRYQRTVVGVLAQGYLDRYPVPADTMAHTINLEREVAIDDPILGRGRLDAVQETWANSYGPTGPEPALVQRLGIEDKLLTLAFWRGVDEAALDYDPQVSAYFLAMQKAGRPLHKLEYRVTFKPGIKVSSKEKIKEDYTDQGLANYAARLRKKMAAEPEKFYRRYELYRSPEELAMFEASVERVEEDMRRAKAQYTRSKDLGALYQNKQACSMYGGCAMQDLCRGLPGAEARYRPKPVRPSSKLQVDVLDAVAKAFAPPQATDIAAILGVPSKSVPSALRALERRELVVRGEGDTWTLTGAGARLAADR